jgi:hypothetical protein
MEKRDSPEKSQSVVRAAREAKVGEAARENPRVEAAQEAQEAVAHLENKGHKEIKVIPAIED